LGAIRVPIRAQTIAATAKPHLDDKLMMADTMLDAARKAVELAASQTGART